MESLFGFLIYKNKDPICISKIIDLFPLRLVFENFEKANDKKLDDMKLLLNDLQGRFRKGRSTFINSLIIKLEEAPKAPGMPSNE